MPESVTWTVGDQVLCHGRRADVRFVGTTSFAEGTWVGVEFRKVSAGRNDGSVDGIRYFGPTEPNHALFVLADDTSDLKPHSPQDEAAAMIQAQVRRKQDSEAAHYTQIFRAFNEMESRAESEQLNCNKTCSRASHLLQEQVQEAPSVSRVPTFNSQTLEALLSGASVVSEEVATEVGSQILTERAPAAPRVRFETFEDGSVRVPKDCIEEVISHFKRPAAAPLSAACISRLLQHGGALLRQEVKSAVHEISTPPAPGHLLVLGDTHGQLEDVLWILFEHGLPSPENVYLFNGDVCDRGTGAVEIIVLILLFKLWEPGCIFLNRGNHEDPCMNEAYGFQAECINKWGTSKGIELFDAFNSFFYLLPFFTIIDSSVFVVHGGLWRKDFTLAQLRRADFRRPLPEGAGRGLDVICFDSVWSDPMPNKGIGSNSRGDSIVSFGEDVTRRFLKANRLTLLVRSHQVPESGQGFEWWHRGKCVTIFSASNYCGEAGNLGGVLLLQRGEQPTIMEHWAPTLEELQTLEGEAMSAQERIGKEAVSLSMARQKRKQSVQKMEAEIVRRVQEQVVKHKSELFEYWSDVDESPHGVFRISAALWREGCAAIIDDSLPWVRLQEVMGVTGESGQVHYVQFLARYRVAFQASFGISAAGWEQAVWSKLMGTLLRADLPLREALAALDATNDGLVSPVEFGRLLQSCRIGISGHQARALLRSILTNGETSADAGRDSPTEGRVNNRVSVWDMLGRLQVTLPVARAQGIDPEVEAWAVPKLRPLAAAVLDDTWKRIVPPNSPADEWPVSKLLAAWFEDIDSSHNGYLETCELLEGLQNLGPSLLIAGCPNDPDSCARLVAYCDVDGNGRINYFELLNALSWEDALGPEHRKDMLECTNAAVYFNMAPIKRALQSFDREHTGTVTPEDFMLALKGVSTALGPDGGGLTKTEIETMTAHLPRTLGNTIEYDKFLRSFHIVDSYCMAAGLGVTVPIAASDSPLPFEASRRSSTLSSTQTT